MEDWQLYNQDNKQEMLNKIGKSGIIIRYDTSGCSDWAYNSVIHHRKIRDCFYESGILDIDTIQWYLKNFTIHSYFICHEHPLCDILRKMIHTGQPVYWALKGHVDVDDDSVRGVTNDVSVIAEMDLDNYIISFDKLWE